MVTRIRFPSHQNIAWSQEYGSLVTKTLHGHRNTVPWSPKHCMVTRIRFPGHQNIAWSQEYGSLVTKTLHGHRNTVPWSPKHCMVTGIRFPGHQNIAWSQEYGSLVTKTLHGHRNKVSSSQKQCSKEVNFIMSICINGLAMLTLRLSKRELSGSSLRWIPMGGFAWLIWKCCVVEVCLCCFTAGERPLGTIRKK